MKTVKREYIPRYSYSDYVNWEGKWELIDGIAYAMSPSPSIEHQEASKRILLQLTSILKDCPECTALLPVDWKIDEDTVVQPDNLVVCGNVKGKFLTEPPEIIFEIMSPSTVFKDRNIKYELYEAQKVKYYIIVDIEAKVAEVFRLESDKYAKMKDVQTGTVPFVLGECTLAFDFGAIW